MSEVSAELVWLLERLRSTPSRRGRLRLLLEAWQSVRGLSPTDRLLVARELGFDGAERLVEEVAHRGGFDASPWLEMLGEAEDSNPEELSEVVRGLADPRRRSATVGRLLEGAGAWLAGGESLEVPTGGPPASAQPDALQDSQADHADGAERAAYDEVRPGMIGAAPERDGEQAAAAEPADSSPLPVASSPEADGVDAETAAAGSASGRLASEPPAGSAAAAEPPAPAAEAASARLLEELTAEPRIQRRLARLGREAGALELAPQETLEAVLESFPAGWARRRALQRLLEAGIPESVKDAVALLGVLERPSERLWAATTLMESRALDDDDWDAVLEAVASPAVRRRLQWRRARALGRDRT